MKIYNISLDNELNLINSESIYEQRFNNVVVSSPINRKPVTIMILAYNRLDKTKKCVEALLEYTKDVDYELLLVNNGSNDGTSEYFRSIDYKNTVILDVDRNISASFVYNYISLDRISKYFVILANDIIVTKNWLSNLIKTAESDPKIGMVNPMSSNVSNLQQVDFNFSNFEEMQTKAANFNISDPRKWHERLRLITIGTLFKKECIYAIGVPLADVGFAHNFGDDDITFRVRRAGYKAILAGDTWIHHDDNKTNLPYETAKKINNDLKIGRENFKEKYFGIDAWDDVNNYIPEYLGALKAVNKAKDALILGVDVKCGTPILEIKNELRKYNIFDAQCFAFTTDAKYMIDLQTVCGAYNVFNGAIGDFSESFQLHSFDYIVIGNDINTYPDPFKIIKSAYNLLKPHGQLFISLQNTNNILNFAYSIGSTNIRDVSHATNYTVEEFLSQLMQLGYDATYIAARGYDAGVLSQGFLNDIGDCLNKLPIKDRNETMFRLTSQRYYFVICGNE